jgi:hypothetical protein
MALHKLPVLHVHNMVIINKLVATYTSNVVIIWGGGAGGMTEYYLLVHHSVTKLQVAEHKFLVKVT